MKKLLALILSLSVFGAFGAESVGSPTSATFTVNSTFNSALMSNPDRGITAGSSNDIVNQQAGYQSGITQAYNAGYRLVYCPIDLAQFLPNANISSTFLTTLNASFAMARAQGVKCMTLIGYNLFSGTLPGSDPSAAQIAIHAGQLASTLQANADVIPYSKAGFMGQYAEWHDSGSGNSCAPTGSGSTETIQPCNATVYANQDSIRNALLNMYPLTTLVGFRYPAITYRWYPTFLTSTQAWSGSQQSRVGWHDDCALAGTITPGVNNFNYDFYGFLALDGSGTALQSTYISMLQTITNWVGSFGELANGCTPNITDCASAITWFSQYHANTFKIVYSAASNWTTGPGGSGPWDTGGCFYTIANSYGYVLTLDSVTHQSTVNRGDSISVNVKMHNNGWARFNTARKLYVNACLVASPNTCYQGIAYSDLRLLPPQTTTSSTVTAHITIPAGATTGAYQIRLSVPDIFSTTQSRPFMVKFNNDNNGSQIWNDTAGYITTGTTLTVN